MAQGGPSPFPAYLTYVAQHKPERIAVLARNVPGIAREDDVEAAGQGIAALKVFFASLGMPSSFAELGIEQPDIELLVRKLHLNKGERIGSFYPLCSEDTAQMFRLAL